MKKEEQIGDVYYNWDDAIDNAMQIVIDSRMAGLRECVEVWESEGIKDAPCNMLKWMMNKKVWL